ncbi:MAG: hypothetical protein AB1921_01340 [Thermodesulfobacteriota bacterium]
MFKEIPRSSGGTDQDTRTFLVLYPASLTGSDLDVVVLYQYNQVNGVYTDVKLAEDSLDLSGL